MAIIEFIFFMFRPRAIKQCFRMNSFDRLCYSTDYLKLQIKASLERINKQQREASNDANYWWRNENDQTTAN